MYPVLKVQLVQQLALRTAVRFTLRGKLPHVTGLFKGRKSFYQLKY